MLKSFQTYIFELSKPSEFRIKLAGTNPVGETMDRIKAALETYQLESVSAVKSLPIQEHREFPQWGGACECWQFDVKLAYPTTNIAIMQTLKERAHLNPTWINVRNLQEAEYTEEAEMRGSLNPNKGVAVLDDDNLQDAPGGQDMAGQRRVGSLLKELESRKFEFAQDSKESGKTTNDAPMGEKGPMSTQNKVYRKPGSKGSK
jgi:hypothetical protein